MSPGRRPSIQVARLSETVLSAAMTDPSTAELTKAGKVRLAGEALAASEQLLRALPRPAAVSGLGEALGGGLGIAQRPVRAASHGRPAQPDGVHVYETTPAYTASGASTIKRR